VFDNLSRRSRWARAATATVALAAAAAAVQVTMATAASAAPSSVVSGASTTDSAARKSATARCPSGTRVFGGGGDIVGGGHEVALTGLRPVSTVVNGRYVDSFVATAEEDDTGYASNWTVYAYAICGPNLPNLSIQTGVQSWRAGTDRVNASASCPSGTAPVGLGAEISGGNGNVVLNSMLGNYTAGPYGVFSGWANAQAFIDESGYGGPWSLASYAVCASPPPGLTYKFVDSPNYDSNDKSANAQCPVGTKVYGVGGYLSYLNGETHFDRMVPHGSQWDGADVEAREDQDGFSNIWWTTVEAICAQ
jgi:hypothetical protein